jgi:lipoprotein Spr
LLTPNSFDEVIKPTRLRFGLVFAIIARWPNIYKKPLSMRNLLYLAAILVIGGSCSTMKSSSTSASPSTTAQQAAKKPGSPEFLENISLKPVKETGTIDAGSSGKSNTSGAGDKVNIEYASPLLLKYAILMNAPVEELNNEKLINFIDDWYGTKYRLGGE